MNLIDEYDVTRPKLGQEACKGTLMLDSGTGGRLDLHAKLSRDDPRKGRLSQTRRPMEQHVIKRIATCARRGNSNGQLVLDVLLTDIVGKASRTQRIVIIVTRGTDNPQGRGFVGHRDTVTKIGKGASINRAKGVPGHLAMETCAKGRSRSNVRMSSVSPSNAGNFTPRPDDRLRVNPDEGSTGQHARDPQAARPVSPLANA